MKPVQPIFRLRIQILLHLPYVISAVGEKRHLLIHGHALRLQQLEQPPPRLAIIGLHETETLLGLLGFGVVALEFQHTLAGNHLEASPLVPGAHKASIQPDRQWPGKTKPGKVYAKRLEAPGTI